MRKARMRSPVGTWMEGKATVHNPCTRDRGMKIWEHAAESPPSALIQARKDFQQEKLWQVSALEAAKYTKNMKRNKHLIWQETGGKDAQMD